MDEIIKYKLCSICNVNLKINCFYSKGAQCKNCCRVKKRKYHEENKDNVKKINKKFREKNKDKIKSRRIIYYKENKEKILAQQKGYRDNHVEEIAEQCKKYRAKNRDKVSQCKKDYYEKNIEYIKEYFKIYQKENINKLNEYSRVYQKERRATDICFKLRRDFSAAIGSALSRQLSSKNGQSISKYLPYSIEELKKHLEKQFEPWMNWNNRDTYRRKAFIESDSLTWVWHIDHIIPHSDLPYDSMEHENFKKAWALSNLRTLRADINISEGSSRIRHKKAG